MRWPDLVKQLAARAGLSVHRWPANRFEAVDDALLMLRGAGFAPRRIIDGGANQGQFAAAAARVFPGARLDLIEPQAECAPALARFAAARGRTEIHTLAVTAPGSATLAMHRGGSAAASTGAFVIAASQPYEADLHTPATTLDALFASQVSPGDRTLLKLDLEGHERAALLGASTLLRAIEVLYVEVTFYDIARAGRPLFLELATFLAERGFDLFDFAMLASRRRDQRLRIGDAIFVRTGSPLAIDVDD